MEAIAKIEAPSAPEPMRATIRERLGSLRPSDLPAPPQAAMRVLQACSDPKSDARRIGHIVGADPALTAEILRIVNSPYFGLSREVSTAAHAVSVLGQRPLRNFVLCVAAREALRPEVVHGLDTRPYWDASVRRAAAARILAPRVGLDPDESFTLGMLQDVGLLALLFLHPERAGAWEDLLRAHPEARLELEHSLFGMTHDDVGYALAESWQLPQSIADAIGGHHRYGRGLDVVENTPARRVALAADWIAGVYAGGEARANVLGARLLLARDWKIGKEESDELIASVGEQARMAAGALGVSLGAAMSYEDILRDSNLALAEEHLSHQELAWRLESAVADRDRIAAEMRAEIDKARVVQRALLPAPSFSFDVSSEERVPLAGLNAPARDLSGDFFDYFEIGDGRWMFNVADVSGKGMDAALTMAKTSSLLRCLGKRVHDPRKLLAIVNDEVRETAVRGMFVTVVSGLLDVENERAFLVNAGHPPPLVHDARGEFKVIPAQGPPLGVLAGAAYEGASVDLAGGSLYLFSDGLIEMANGDRTRLGYHGVMDLVREHAASPKANRLARMLGALRQRGGEAGDDVTLLVVEPGVPERVSA